MPCILGYTGNGGGGGGGGGWGRDAIEMELLPFGYRELYTLAGPVQIAHLCHLYSVENLLESKLHNCATSTAWRTF